jgi:hypothetical protein
VTIDGETKSASAWAAIMGINRKTVIKRFG